MLPRRLIGYTRCITDATERDSHAAAFQISPPPANWLFLCRRVCALVRQSSCCRRRRPERIATQSPTWSVRNLPPRSHIHNPESLGVCPRGNGLITSPTRSYEGRELETKSECGTTQQQQHTRLQYKEHLAFTMKMERCRTSYLMVLEIQSSFSIKEWWVHNEPLERHLTIRTSAGHQ